MIDGTRSAIEEDFSLEEQNFQTVIDTETEDDYSRGNVVLSSGNYSLDTGAGGTSGSFPPVTLLTTGNYFIEQIDVCAAYGFTHVGNVANYLFTVTLSDNLGHFYFNTAYYAGATSSSTWVFNLPIVIDTEIILPRGVSLILGGGTTPTGAIVISCNIYGRILP